MQNLCIVHKLVFEAIPISIHLYTFSINSKILCNIWGVIHLLHCVEMRTNNRRSFCKVGSTNAQMEMSIICLRNFGESFKTFLPVR